MIVQASKTIAAAANYTIGDIVSESATVGTAWEFKPIQLYENRRGIVTHAVLTSTEDSVTARYRLHLFTANPSASELNDNVAKDFDNDDSGKYVGYVDFPPMADQGEPAWAATPTYVGFQLAAGVESLYGVLEDLSGETNETASMVFTIRLFIEDVR